MVTWSAVFASAGPGGRVTQAEIDAMRENLATVANSVDQQLADQILAETLPLIGPNLHTAWENNANGLIFLRRFHTQTVIALNTFNNAADYDPETVATAIRNRLINSGGFGSASFTIGVTTLNDQAQLTFTHNVAYPAINVPIAPDIGLPNLEVRIIGSHNARTVVTPNVSLTFGVDGGGFYLDTQSAAFQLNTHTTISSLSATGTFAGLPVAFTRNTTTALLTNVPANFAVTIKDPGNDGRLRPAEASQPGADLIDATVTGNTRTSIKVDSTISPLVTLPRAGADLVLFWNFNQSAVDSSDDNATFGSRPIFHLENQRLYLDSFFDSFAGRVISQVEAVTAPLQPVGDVLTTAIPILSDLGSSDVTMLDIVGANESIVPILGGLNKLLDLAELASTLSVAPHVIVGLGAWGNVVGDLRTDALDEISGEPIHSTANTRPSQVTTFLNQAAAIPGLEFPILENPLAATGLLLGREADLFAWRTPELALSTNFQSYFPVLGPLGITLGGQVGVEMGFGFGFDTQGVIDYRRAASPTDSLFFNGFYAMALNDSGAPLTGITLSAGVTAGIELNLLIASAGVEGDITATVGIYLDDMLGDDLGRVRGDVFETLPMSQWFYAAGSLSAGVRAYLELGWGPFSIEFDFESPRVVLINFDSRDTDQPTLAGYDFNHPTDPFALHLNIGERAHLRIHRDTDDRAEELYIRKGSYWDIANQEDYQQYNLDDLFNFQPTDDILAIEGFGAVRLYPVPPKIVGHGNLRGDLISIDRDTDIPVHLTGGDGYDILRGGSADDLLEGGDGPDLLNGRGGNNILLGGPGNDELIAGDGNNILDGGPGEDTASWLEASIPLVMDLRTNTFAGAAAGDTLISIERYKGTLHDDTMHGSEGNDNLNGLSGNDVIHGHGGDDVLVGGFGDDQLFGGEGNDYLDGGPGADLLDGGPGIDIASYLSAKSPVTVSLETGLGTRGDALGDVLVSIEVLMGSGLPENQNTPAHLSGDILEGGPGNDIIYGMAGNDLIRGGGGDDILYGNHPDILTFVPPGFDDDTIYGGPGNDILYGQDGDDYLDGEEGHDTLYGGPGNDHLVTFDLAHQDHLDGAPASTACPPITPTNPSRSPSPLARKTPTSFPMATNSTAWKPSATCAPAAVMM